MDCDLNVNNEQVSTTLPNQQDNNMNSFLNFLPQSENNQNQQNTGFLQLIEHVQNNNVRSEFPPTPSDFSQYDFGTDSVPVIGNSIVQSQVNLSPPQPIQQFTHPQMELQVPQPTIQTPQFVQSQKVANEDDILDLKILENVFSYIESLEAQNEVWQSPFKLTNNSMVYPFKVQLNQLRIKYPIDQQKIANKKYTDKSAEDKYSKVIKKYFTEVPKKKSCFFDPDIIITPPVTDEKKNLKRQKYLNGTITVTSFNGSKMASLSICRLRGTAQYDRYEIFKQFSDSSCVGRDDFECIFSLCKDKHKVNCEQCTKLYNCVSSKQVEIYIRDNQVFHKNIGKNSIRYKPATEDQFLECGRGLEFPLQNGTEIWYPNEAIFSVEYLHIAQLQDDSRKRNIDFLGNPEESLSKKSKPNF